MNKAQILATLRSADVPILVVFLALVMLVAGRLALRGEPFGSGYLLGVAPPAMGAVLCLLMVLIAPGLYGQEGYGIATFVSVLLVMSAGAFAFAQLIDVAGLGLLAPEGLHRTDQMWADLSWVGKVVGAGLLLAVGFGRLTSRGKAA